MLVDDISKLLDVGPSKLMVVGRRPSAKLSCSIPLSTYRSHVVCGYLEGSRDTDTQSTTKKEHVHKVNFNFLIILKATVLQHMGSKGYRGYNIWKESNLALPVETQTVTN